MALTDEEQRQCFKHLAYPLVRTIGAGVGELVLSTVAVDMLQFSLDSLTANGETTVREILPILEDKWTKLSTMDSRAQAMQVGSIKLDAAKEWELRQTQYDYYRRQLAVVLHVTLDPPSRADEGGGAPSPFQGPFREP